MSARSHFSKYGSLAFLLIGYFILTLAYSYTIPFSKGPDEYIHYRYSLFIATHGRWPISLTERQEAGVRSDWPPLYQLLVAAAAAPVTLAPPPELKVTWQPATRQLIDLILPRATLVRTEDEHPPYRGVYALWQIGRWVSIALGAGTLIITYLIGLSLWPQQPALAAGATALLVFCPRFLFTHAVLSDDPLLGFCLALYLLLLTRLILTVQPSLITHSPLPPPTPRPVYARLFTVIFLGLTAGLAIMAKYTAIPVVVGGLLSLVFIARPKRWGRHTLWGNIAAFIGASTLAVSWWVGWIWRYFNQINTLGRVMGLLKPLLPGTGVDDNPTLIRMTAFLSGQSSADLGEASGAGGSFIDWVGHSFATFWSVTVFGAEPVWPPYPHLVLLLGLGLISLAAVVGLGRYYRQTGSNRLIWQIFAIHLLLFVPIPLLRFALSGRLNDAAQGRHILIPAGSVIAMMFIAGWLEWFPSRWRSRVALFTGGAMLTWGIVHLFYLGAAYPPPLPVRTTPGPQMQLEQSAQINFGDTLQLAGYQTQTARDGAILQLDLLWHSLAQAQEDYTTEITLLDTAGQPCLRWLSQPAEGRLPVRAWQPGDWVRDTLNLPLAGLTPGGYVVQLRLLGWDAPLPSHQGETITLTTVTLNPVSVPDTIILWQKDQMVAQTASALAFAWFASPPVYRYRSSIPVTLPQPAAVSLVGPDGQPRSPVSDLGRLRLFIVGYDWPSGDYRLQVDGVDSELGLQVENFDHRPGGWKFSVPPLTYPVQANFANQLELLGYDLPLRRFKAGEGIPLVLYWRGLTQMRQDYTIFVQLLDSDLQRRGGYDRLPRETYNTSFWVPGEVVDDGFAVPIQTGAPDGIYTIRVGLYRRVKGQAESLPLVQNGQPLAETSVVIGPVKVGGPPPGIVQSPAAPQTEVKAVLGEQIKLLGYDLADNQCQLSIGNCQLTLTLYWQSLTQTNTDYTVFVHLRDQTGQVVTQADHLPALGRYPTSLWEAGEVIPDSFTLNVPPEIKPGAYQLVVGLYEPATGARLTVPGTADNSLLVTEIGLD